MDTPSGLPLGNTVGNPHFTAQCRQKDDDQLDEIHIMSSHYQLGLFVLHQGGYSVNPCWKEGGLLGKSPLLAVFFLAQANNFCIFSWFVSGLSLWASLGSWVAVWWSKAWVTLLMAGGTFRYLIENSPLLMQPNVREPIGKVDEVPLWLDVLSNFKILGAFLKRDIPPSWPPASSQQQGLVPPSSP